VEAGVCDYGGGDGEDDGEEVLGQFAGGDGIRGGWRLRRRLVRMESILETSFVEGRIVVVALAVVGGGVVVRVVIVNVIVVVVVRVVLVDVVIVSIKTMSRRDRRIGSLPKYD